MSLDITYSASSLHQAPGPSWTSSKSLSSRVCFLLKPILNNFRICTLHQGIWGRRHVRGHTIHLHHIALHKRKHWCFFTLGLVPNFIRYAFQPGPCTRLTGWLPPKCGVDRVDETRHFLFILQKNIHLVQIITCACTLHQGVPRGWRDTRESPDKIW